ncbi:hypothetical protein ACJX0J_031962, partial [Zea mays]
YSVPSFCINLNAPTTSYRLVQMLLFFFQRATAVALVELASISRTCSILMEKNCLWRCFSNIIIAYRVLLTVPVTNYILIICIKRTYYTIDYIIYKINDFFYTLCFSRENKLCQITPEIKHSTI